MRFTGRIPRPGPWRTGSSAGPSAPRVGGLHGAWRHGLAGGAGAARRDPGHLWAVVSGPRWHPLPGAVPGRDGAAPPAGRGVAVTGGGVSARQDGGDLPGGAGTGPGPLDVRRGARGRADEHCGRAPVAPGGALAPQEFRHPQRGGESVRRTPADGRRDAQGPAPPHRRLRHAGLHRRAPRVPRPLSPPRALRALSQTLAPARSRPNGLNGRRGPADEAYGTRSPCRCRRLGSGRRSRSSITCGRNRITR